VSSYFTSRAKDPLVARSSEVPHFKIKGTLKIPGGFSKDHGNRERQSLPKGDYQSIVAYRTVGKVPPTLKNVKLRLADSNVSL
jgi:hypothetical protein